MTIKYQNRVIIPNTDVVFAHTGKGAPVEYTFGKLKNDFISKKLTVVVNFIYHPKTNTNYKVLYNATKGFRINKLEE